MVLAVPLFLLMVLTASIAWRGDQLAAAVLVFESAVWLYVDRRFEGPHLIQFSYYHALVLADLVALAALGVAAVCLLRPLVAQRMRRAPDSKVSGRTCK
jgi:hypothetical protein